MDRQSIVIRDLLTPDHDFSVYAWKPFRSGIDIFPIYQLKNGPSAALLRYQSGAQVPPHLHRAPEHIIVLQGSQSDQRGEYGAGTVVVNLPESTHSVESKNGCVVLAIWSAPVEFIGDQ